MTMRRLMQCLSVLAWIGLPIASANAAESHANRYQESGNGTVTDTATGLVWLRDVDCLRPTHWADATHQAAALAHGACGLADHSSPGDWRLPTAAEWKATIAAARAMQCTGPVLTDVSGHACLGMSPLRHVAHAADSSPFTDNVSKPYWSSSPASAPGFMTYIDLYDGTMGKAGETSNLYIWPVRRGP